MPIKRPEETGPPADFYDQKEARKYTSSSRIVRVQADIAERCIELLALEPGARRLILDVGCGSGLSGAALERAGHEWIGCDVSRHMLRIAAAKEGQRVEEDEDEESESDDESDKEDEDMEESDEDEAPEDARSAKRRRRANGTAEVLEHDMGLGLPFRDARFDGCISVSALQWLCYDNASSQSASRRLGRFFASLYACLRAGSRAALQFYPENDDQAALIAAAASRAGFSGGVVIDYPKSTKARKHYLVLSTDRQAAHRAAARDGDERPGRRGKKRPRKDKQWILQKKDHQRGQGRTVKHDSKFTGRKRKDRF